MVKYRGAVSTAIKTAAVLQIDQDFVQRWRLGLLRFLRSVDVVVNYDTALEFKEVAKQYNHELEDTILERFVKNVLPYELGLPTDIVGHWTKRLRKSAWDLHLDLLSVPLERADDYYTKEARYHRFVSDRDTWVARVHRHARALWKDLKEFVEQYPQYNATATQPYVETLDQQNLSIEGFDVRIVGAGQGYHKKDTAHFLDVAHQALKRYRATAKDKFPWLLRHTLPFVLHFDVTLDKGGEYDPHYITLYMSNLTSSREDMDPVSRLTHTIAHEMGHFVYKQYLGGSAREFWEQAVRQDYGPNLDLQYVLDNWPERYDRLLMVDDVFLAKGDIDTYLQLNSLYYHPHYRYQTQNATKQDVINMMAEDRYLSVPKHPISGYASKSYEEAFCEAFGAWLAWGDHAVYPIVRSWLSVVLPEVSIRTASFGLVGSQVQKKTTPRSASVHHRVADHYEDVGWTPTGRWGNQGSGILFTTGERILLLHRSSGVEEPGTWGIPGGAVPQTSKGTFRDPYVSAKQETREELGTLPTHQVVDQYVYQEDRFRYVTYVAKVSAMTARRFRPTLNWENDDYGWFTQEELQSLDLHFGVVELLHHVDPFFSL
jgi:8-oxo-dGTP pyrophosphatase MutT (NUDIX family)